MTRRWTISLLAIFILIGPPLYVLSYLAPFELTHVRPQRLTVLQVGGRGTLQINIFVPVVTLVGAASTAGLHRRRPNITPPSAITTEAPIGSGTGNE